MDADTTYELIYDAVRQALEDAEGGDGRMLRRFEGGRLIFEDRTGAMAKELPIVSLFKKVTAIREKLRVLEQKLNNHPGLSEAEEPSER